MFLKNAFYLAWMDTRARYKNTLIGPLWLTITNLIGVFGLSIVWANLLNEDLSSFVPSLSVGMIIWQIIAVAISEGPSVFRWQSLMIRNVSMPTWFFVARALSRQVINLIHNFLIVIGVVWYFNVHVQLETLLVIPGVLLVIFNLFWITYILALLGARFRDLEYLTGAFLPILFFISPVIFRPDRLPVNMEIIWLNPLSYFIEIVRAPILGKIPDQHTYIVMATLLITGSITAYCMHKIYNKRLAFWV